MDTRHGFGAYRAIREMAPNAEIHIFRLYNMQMVAADDPPLLNASMLNETPACLKETGHITAGCSFRTGLYVVISDAFC
ncbi:hypothetical protein [Pyruvatibacter sp.]|uniref:hypothetical protein n=1 Tax=Pyruvatibacter sp. TaxID=1981328 RepID=UPI0032EAA471